MESDLYPVSAMNILVKYADNTNLLGPENTDVKCPWPTNIRRSKHGLIKIM